MPTKKKIREWAAAVLEQYRERATLTIRIVDEAESGQLNERWRKVPGATNVLSFPAAATVTAMPELLGDIVICAPLVRRQALDQHKTFDAHLAHMVIHGVLHLLGFDHVKKREAAHMEAIETELLDTLGYPDPYLLTQ